MDLSKRIELIKNYREEKKKWKAAGKPSRDDIDMKRIYDICRVCPAFEKGGGAISGYDRCGVCLCNLHPSRKKFNKISWATTNCPDVPPQW